MVDIHAYPIEKKLWHIVYGQCLLCHAILVELLRWQCHNTSNAVNDLSTLTITQTPAHFRSQSPLSSMLHKNARWIRICLGVHIWWNLSFACLAHFTDFQKWYGLPELRNKHKNKHALYTLLCCRRRMSSTQANIIHSTRTRTCQRTASALLPQPTICMYIYRFLCIYNTVYTTH